MLDSIKKHRSINAVNLLLFAEKYRTKSYNKIKIKPKTYEDSPGHARGTYRDNAKALTKITNSLRCNFGIGIHPRVNPW
ncbi:hypothetical protein AB4491_16365, partial [Vibrio sp. 10N.261.45.A7]